MEVSVSKSPVDIIILIRPSDAQTFDKSLDTGVKQEGTPWQNIDHLIVQYIYSFNVFILI